MADISKITLPSGNTYDIKDAVARAAIAGGVSFIIAWDGTSTPVVADIPAGVVVKYNNTDYTGTLSADNAVVGAFYLVKSATQAGGTLDVYDEYVPVGTSPKSWEKIGDTQLNLTDVVTNVTLSKQTDTVIGSDATFTITQPTIALSTGATAGTGVISVATGITSASASGDSVTALTGLGTPSTETVLKGAKPKENDTNVTNSIQYVKAQGTATTTKISGSATGGAVGANTNDNVTAVTGLGTPTTDTFLKGVQVTTQPTVSLTANTTTDTGRITYVQSQGTAITTKLGATASGAAVSATGDNVTVITGLGTASTESAVKSVTPTTKKLATTTITGVSGSTNITPVESRTSQTTATGGWTALVPATTPDETDNNNNDIPDINENLLAKISVSNETLTIGAATLNTQTTYSAGAPRASLAVPTASSATTVATGSTTTTGSGADIVTDVSVGDTFSAVTGYASPTTDTVIGTASTFNVTQPTITIASGSSGDVTVATGINAATTRYLSASASGTAVGADGTGSAITAITPTTDTVLGADTSFNVTDPTITIASGATGDVTVATGINAATIKYLTIDANGTASAITDITPTTDTVLGTGSTITVTPTTTNIKATATGANTAWNSKDQVTVLTNATDVSVTKGNG